LHQDFFFAAEANQIPDDQEISGEIELLDQFQLSLNLLAGAVSKVGCSPAIALLKTFPGAFPQERHHGVAFRHGIFGKFVSQVFQREFEA
jgi:hypothetical protein